MTKILLTLTLGVCIAGTTFSKMETIQEKRNEMIFKQAVQQMLDEDEFGSDCEETTFKMSNGNTYRVVRSK